MTVHTNTICNSDFIVEQVTYPADLHMPFHQDRYSGISVILKGAINENTGTSIINAEAGGVIIKPTSTLHENTFGNIPVTLLTIKFLDDSVFRRHFKKWQYVNHPKAHIHAIQLWIEMRCIKNYKGLMNSINKFTSEALKETDDEIKAIWWVEELKDILTKNFDQHENIHAISEKLSLHRVYMGRAFKKKYSISPVEYRKHIRIASVLTDLIMTQKSLAAIALDAGFADQSHMSREFKSITNSTPAAVKKVINSRLHLFKN